MNHPFDDCPVCQKSLAPGDDIVTCPSCGAPYHRDCYLQEGHCVFEDKHASGFEYQSPKAPVPGPESETSGGANDTGTSGTGSSRGIPCPSCGTLNTSRNIFCENCGAPLHGSAADSASTGGRRGWTQNGPMPFGSAAFVNMSGDIDGIPKAEWAAYIGNSAPIYLKRMSAQQGKNGKTSFMFSPFFFGSFYFAYRKMWGWTAIAFVSYFLLLIPGLLLILAQNGFVPLAALSTSALSTLSTLTVIANYLSIIRQILFGVFGLYLYRKHGAKKMQELKKRAPAGLTPEQLTVEGGTSVWGPVIVGVIFFAISIFLYIFAGDAIMQYYYSTFLA